MKRGAAGSLARAFLFSKLTPLIVAFALLLGVFAISVTPREEEPQIVVPMVDVMVSFPGASSSEVEELVTNPMEKLLWEIDGVEYVYSMSQPGQNLTIVRFYVGQDLEGSLVKLYTKLMANYDRIPQGVSQPLIKARSIDDVPVLTLSLWSPNDLYGGYELRRVAMEVADELKKGQDVAGINIIGGQEHELRVELDPGRLTTYGLSPLAVQQTLQQANMTLAAGSYITNNKEIKVEGQGFFNSAADVEQVIVGVNQGRPVYLRDVARIVDGPAEANHVSLFQAGASASEKGIKGAGTGRHEAVTIALAKKKGTNATEVVDDALRRLAELKGDRIPSDISVTVTRNYGATAKEKSDELLQHILIATLSVAALILFFLGWREAVVVLVAVPVTLALTLLVNYLYGYTLNRVTLFALIFSIGILVDDAIVVVENIHRHFKLHGVSPETAAMAVDEVGNPTILATITVITALLPMAFVRGLMGPYMRPIPVGASAAMFFSLLIAFIVTPWLSYKLLKKVKHEESSSESSGNLAERYRRFMEALMSNARWRKWMLVGISALLLLSMALVPLKAVLVKMMPFDNKSEFQVIVDMPEGTSQERTQIVLDELMAYLVKVPEVTDCQAYVGTSAPFNFNGLIRHYYLRNYGYQGDIQVNLVEKGQRKDQSHDIAKRVRADLEQIALAHGAKLKIAEIPPGPPVMSTLMAEVYAPDAKTREQLANKVLDLFKKAPGVLEPDMMREADQPKDQYVISRDKAALAGVSVAAINETLRMGLTGTDVGLLHIAREKEPVPIRLRMPQDLRNNPQLLQQLSLPTLSGNHVNLAELVTVKPGIEDKTIHHKNLQPVVYVTGDVGGRYESPGYSVLAMRDEVAKLGDNGSEIPQYYANQPEKRVPSVKWDGEVHITAEVFRDMGMAFAAVLVLIYVLVVAWFRSFIIPLVIMAPIPLTLVGILPAHALSGVFFTATSMIGFIALAGIIVRNSLLLVDFIQHSRNNGMELHEAVLTAGTVRMRPIVLTAAAVMVGSIVMLFDPIFQGLALAMMFGAVTATMLTLIAVPILYVELAPWITEKNDDIE